MPETFVITVPILWSAGMALVVAVWTVFIIWSAYRLVRKSLV